MDRRKLAEIVRRNLSEARARSSNIRENRKLLREVFMSNDELYQFQDSPWHEEQRNERQRREDEARALAAAKRAADLAREQEAQRVAAAAAAKAAKDAEVKKRMEAEAAAAKAAQKEIDNIRENIKQSIEYMKDPTVKDDEKKQLAIEIDNDIEKLPEILELRSKMSELAEKIPNMPTARERITLGKEHDKHLASLQTLINQIKGIEAIEADVKTEGFNLARWQKLSGVGILKG